MKEYEYVGHRAKVKVTGAKRSKFPIPAVFARQVTLVL